jgi:hypothetical protein
VRLQFPDLTASCGVFPVSRAGAEGDELGCGQHRIAATLRRVNHAPFEEPLDRNPRGELPCRGSVFRLYPSPSILFLVSRVILDNRNTETRGFIVHVLVLRPRGQAQH